eukprot:UN13050
MTLSCQVSSGTTSYISLKDFAKIVGIVSEVYCFFDFEYILTLNKFMLFFAKKIGKFGVLPV